MRLKVSNIIITSIVVSAYLIGSNSFIISYLSYLVNIDYLKAYKCVERQIPRNTCQACCQLEHIVEQDDNAAKHDNIPIIIENSVQAHFKALLYLFNTIHFYQLYDFPLFSEPLLSACINPDTPPPEFS